MQSRRLGSSEPEQKPGLMLRAGGSHLGGGVVGMGGGAVAQAETKRSTKAQRMAQSMRYGMGCCESCWMQDDRSKSMKASAFS